jgi:ABC-type multidrug transport system fused ATPase/permease subunit
MSSCRSQIFLLDDPFSAVDGNTGNWIFEHGVMRLLHDKVRIVALNSHLHLLKYFDRILVLDNGEIVADGAPSELARSHRDLIARVTGFSPDDLISASPLTITSANDLEPADCAEEPAVLPTDGDGVTFTNAELETNIDIPKAPLVKKATTMALIEKEKASVGAVSYATYIRYFSASLVPRDFFDDHIFYEENKSINFKSWSRFVYGSVLMTLLLTLFVVAQLGRVAVDFFLLRWATAGGSKDSDLEKAYYIAIGILVGALLFRSKMLNHFAILSSKNLHAAVFRTVISASVPLFYDTHTIGEVLNRFSKDCETMDVNIPEFMLQMLVNQLQVLSAFALCIYASPWFALIMLPLAVGFYMMFQYFSAVSRDLKKLEAVTRSPIYAALSETLTGLETIRAYGDTDRFFQNYLARMERNEKFFYHLWMCMSWVTARLELASSFVLMAVAILTVGLRSSVSPIALGLALSYSLQLTALFQRTVQLTIDVTTYMTATERMCEYLTVPQEHSTLPVIENNTADAKKLLNSNDAQALIKWSPKSGKIDFNNVWLSYRGNPPVLKGVSFSVRHGERVGVCGRTGAGKVRIFNIYFTVCCVYLL